MMVSKSYDLRRLNGTIIAFVCSALAVAATSGVHIMPEAWDSHDDHDESLKLTMVEWNVGWFALDDPLGRAAIVTALDTLDVPHHDFVVLIEAEGDTPNGKLGVWTNRSKVLNGLRVVQTRTGHETLAVYYNASSWSNTHTLEGSFETGRPWLLVHFVAPVQEAARRSTAPVAAAGVSPARLESDGDGGSLWVLAVHTPHFLDRSFARQSPGAILAEALKKGAAATGMPVGPVAVVGDFNEFEWEDNPCPPPHYPPDCRPQAARRMAQLWDGFFAGGAVDVVENHTITCCTKWSPRDRHSTPYQEWRFEYDHIFVAGGLC